MIDPQGAEKGCRHKWAHDGVRHYDGDHGETHVATVQVCLKCGKRKEGPSEYA